MHYSELSLPASLSPYVAAVWTLDVGGSAQENFHRDAVPDGCVELILRHSGTSSWHGQQPPRFAAGLCTAPARLEMSGDASFTGVRLWPWAWNMIGDVPCPEFHNNWIVPGDGLLATALLGSGKGCIERLEAFFDGATPSPVAGHIPQCASPGDLVQRSGKSARFLQRWFRQQVGLPPRQYFRLLRFQNSIARPEEETLGGAEQAAAAGYADQSHMTREFRRFAKETPRRLTRVAKGPFVDRSGEE